MKIFDIDWWLTNIRKHGFGGLAIEVIVKLRRLLSLKIEKIMFSIGRYGLDEKELLIASHFKSLDALIAHFNSRNNALFFFNSKFRTQYIQLLSQQYKDEVLNQASKVLSHQFTILGVDVEFEEQIDWHLDPMSSYRWQKKFYGDLLPVFNTTDNTDAKLPYELSRLQHFVLLGIAYWISEDEKYTVEFITELEDWIKENPYLVGVNWTCSMDVAIRAVNIIWGYYFFKNSQKLTKHFQTKFFKSMLEHGRYILNHLENIGPVTGNHYLSDIVGLVFLGIMFPEFKEAKRWREFGLSELVNEMDKQVYEDGVDFEASISYHRLVLELFAYSAILCKINGIRLPQSFWDRLEKMFEFVMYYTKSNGTAPQIGDNDDGRLFILSNYGNWDRTDHRYLLAIGGELFDRDDFRIAGGEFEDVVWLTNMISQPAVKEEPSKTFSCQSRGFPDAGIYIMRQDDLYMIIDCGRNGQNGNGGHSHNDTLSFELYAGDRTFIVDPGTYVYTSDPEWRNRFRSTAYHNTIVVDDKEQNEIDKYKLFSLKNESNPKVNQWVTNDEYDFLDAEHYGYHRLKEPVTHRRQIKFNKQRRFWIIKDMIIGKGTHKIDRYFHFDSGIELEVLEDLVVRAKCRAGASLLLQPLGTKGLNLSIMDGWVSKRYGVKEQAPVLRYSILSPIPVSFRYLLMPLEKGILLSSEKIEQILKDEKIVR